MNTVSNVQLRSIYNGNDILKPSDYTLCVNCCLGVCYLWHFPAQMVFGRQIAFCVWLSTRLYICEPAVETPLAGTYLLCTGPSSSVCPCMLGRDRVSGQTWCQHQRKTSRLSFSVQIDQTRRLSLVFCSGLQPHGDSNRDPTIRVLSRCSLGDEWISGKRSNTWTFVYSLCMDQSGMDRGRRTSGAVCHLLPLMVTTASVCVSDGALSPSAGGRYIFIIFSYRLNEICITQPEYV